MQNILKIVLIMFVSVSLQSCQNMNKQGGGALLGTATGALLGAQFGKGGGKAAAVGIGAIAGALIGGSIGKSMDEQDRKLAELSSNKALEYSPSGSSVEWDNPDNGNHGTITPTKTYREEGRYCREYSQEVFIDGERQKAYGKACRQPDGTWKIVQ